MKKRGWTMDEARELLANPGTVTFYRDSRRQRPGPNGEAIQNSGGVTAIIEPNRHGLVGTNESILPRTPGIIKPVGVPSAKMVHRPYVVFGRDGEIIEVSNKNDPTWGMPSSRFP